MLPVGIGGFSHAASATVLAAAVQREMPEASDLPVETSGQGNNCLWAAMCGEVDDRGVIRISVENAKVKRQLNAAELERQPDMYSAAAADELADRATVRSLLRREVDGVLTTGEVILAVTSTKRPELSARVGDLVLYQAQLRNVHRVKIGSKVGTLPVNAVAHIGFGNYAVRVEAQQTRQYGTLGGRANIMAQAKLDRRDVVVVSERRVRGGRGRPTLGRRDLVKCD